ncbi:MAG: type II methionyl aminopeptidase [Candidatus Nanohaloarchaeota archaeon QJJ-7]|nr:type II methionyl aminopeptidase [Candidatus Nanohaloarchaeota archaeon QJJ-7]
MDDDTRDKYVEAGRIAREARELAVEIASPGTELVNIAEKAEEFIREEGAEPAFPVNLSLNDHAAHYTPSRSDDTVIEEEDLLNIDVGAHVDGYIGDTAVTVDPSGENQELVEASEDALDAALDIIEPGVSLGDIGAAIQEAIDSYGFSPVRNLSGHGLGHYEQHTGKTIPNIDTGSGKTLEEGEAVAIEPFATDGKGKVKDGGPGNIYRLDNENARGRTGRKILGEVKNRFRGLPFTSRWIESVPAARLKTAMSNLVRSGNLHSYDILREAGEGLVSQKEHTVIVGEDPTVTTR